MTSLLVIGAGYSAQAFLRLAGKDYDRITVTVRSAEKAAALTASGLAGCSVTALPFDGFAASPALEEALAEASHLLMSAPPDAGGDPFLRYLSLPASLTAAVYLSTVGVYGDHGGAWVNEETQPAPTSQRSQWRLAAEQAWQLAGGDAAVPVTVLRLAGIYGPGQNALVNLRQGTARRLIKPGQVFNRIHVADIAQAIRAALLLSYHGIVNVTDDEPAPPQDVVAFAAQLLDLSIPPDIPFETAQLSPMARSFYSENKRVRNMKLRQELNVNLLYPHYRSALTALMAEGEGQDEQ